MQLLHADSFHSPTWFLDYCTSTSHPNHRLLLTNYDLGAPVPAKELQLGLDFNATAPELLGGQEMGEDALLVLNQYITLFKLWAVNTASILLPVNPSVVRPEDWPAESVR